MASRAENGWWFFIDEIASGTDPVEGAALARGILEHFCNAGSRCVVTTHLEELKALGITDKRFGNARVGLDPDTMKPTFHLETGAAGTSTMLRHRAGFLQKYWRHRVVSWKREGTCYRAETP